MLPELEKHKLELARDLVADLELSRLGPEQLLLKAARLARLLADEQTFRFVNLELTGYAKQPEVRELMVSLGRLVKADDDIGYWQPLAALSSLATTMQLEVQQLNLPNVTFAPSSSNPNEFVTGFGGLTAQRMNDPVLKTLQRLTELSNGVSRIASIRSRVFARLHSFCTRTLYEMEFGSLAEGIFAEHKTIIDKLLAAQAGDVLEKLPAIYDRLRSDDPEAISQALNSVRRMINSFADAVCPPGEGTVELNGEKYEIGSGKTLNRIKLFLNSRCASPSRCDRLNKTLRAIHERASAGTHGDASFGEARALFLQTYLTLGEILEASEAEGRTVDQPVSAGGG